MTYETLNSERVYSGRAFSVRKDTIRMEGGRTSRMDIVVHNPSVTILPVDAQDRIWFANQYRYAIGDWVLELPAGVIELNELPSETARREIREEIGMGARSLHPLGDFFLAPGYSTERMFVFLARDLYPAPLEGDLDERIEVVKITKSRAYQMVEDGEIIDAKTLAGMLLASRLLLASPELGM